MQEYICFGKPTDTIIPHPNECNSFFICDAGVGLNNVCPEYSFFNPNKMACDPEYSCTDMSTKPPSNQSSTISDSTTSYTTASSVIETLKCPSKDTQAMTFLAHPTRCNAFYLCYYGKPIKFECPIDYHFSKEQRGCVAKTQSKCNVSILIFIKDFTVLIKKQK